MEKRRWTRGQIAEIVAEAQHLGLTYKEAAQRFEIPLWRIYRFNCNSTGTTSPKGPAESRQEPIDITVPNGTGAEKAEPSNRNPEKHSLPEQVRKIIIDYKRENPYSGFKRIEQYLRNKFFLVIPRKRIRQVLKEAGFLELNDSSFDRKEPEAKGTRRFEAGRPGELSQMDITYVYITGLKVLYLINVIDDHSRFCLRSVLRSDQSADTLIEVLHDAVTEYGTPEKLLTDEGTAFYSWSGEKTKFQHYLDDSKIEHIVADPHSPTTTGKVERFHQTIKNELIRKVKFKDYKDAADKIKAYVSYYNYERPHQGLGGVRPADRFTGVAKSTTLATAALVSKELNFDKGYLVFKSGAHEVSIVVKSDEAPEIFVNGIVYRAHHLSNRILHNEEKKILS